MMPSFAIDRPPHQIHGRTDVLPALRLEPYSAFFPMYRPDALERSTTLEDDPFACPSGLSERPSVPPIYFPKSPQVSSVHGVLPSCSIWTIKIYETEPRQSTSNWAAWAAALCRKVYSRSESHWMTTIIWEVLRKEDGWILASYIFQIFACVSQVVPRFGVSPSPFVLSASKSSPRFLPSNLMPDRRIRNTAWSRVLEMHSRLCCRPVLV
jgi:hypothetical protein